MNLGITCSKSTSPSLMDSNHSDFIVVDAKEGQLELQELKKQVEALIKENQELRKELQSKRKVETSHGTTGSFFRTETFNDASGSSILVKAVSMVVAWERILEEALIRMYYPDLIEDFDQRPIRFTNLKEVSCDPKRLQKFFKMKSVKRVLEMGRSEEYLSIAMAARLVDFDHEQLIAAMEKLEQKENVLCFDQSELRRLKYLKVVYVKLSEQPFHKHLVEKCKQLRCL